MRAAAELDMRPLGELIPLPHYVPAPLKSSHLASVPASAANALLDARSSSFVPVPPQTASSIEVLFSSTYARVAWLIPVRGLPPWDGVSGAYVALGDRSSMRMPVPGPAKSQLSSSSTGGSGYPNSDIVWTHASLRQFWSFLRSCSETPGAVTGPLSLSFWAPPRSEHPESQRGTVSSAAAVLADLPANANRETEMTPSNLSLPVPISPALKSRLADIDYVKVYCDAPRAMLVREALGQWVYKGDVPANVEDLRAAAATRILEYAKLVLVNERGEGVLVS
ncbi:hypothetical protein BC827DRAFT_1170202 [Russula dissimulans]|nr:hypothetical protein BC827DRAFT_1170202 [Russula dissimulans]